MKTERSAVFLFISGRLKDAHHKEIGFHFLNSLSVQLLFYTIWFF